MFARTPCPGRRPGHVGVCPDRRRKAVDTWGGTNSNRTARLPLPAASGRLCSSAPACPLTADACLTRRGAGTRALPCSRDTGKPTSGSSGVSGMVRPIFSAISCLTFRHAGGSSLIRSIGKGGCGGKSARGPFRLSSPFCIQRGCPAAPRQTRAETGAGCLPEGERRGRTPASRANRVVEEKWGFDGQHTSARVVQGLAS
jgi:hypothetical protein